MMDSITVGRKWTCHFVFSHYNSGISRAIVTLLYQPQGTNQ